ncbi:GNAT family N-acetyltransferase [Duganella sp. BJB488]|uniref:GNAT family N-acetyltransferase n=1 Tax=unclassified Duganella TaxID=2636909 RepID=UPI000E34A953|nr:MULTISPECIES: GNAT family N-acetyltransferase [unclassified Duganella]NVD71663.1 GNAT family N-acetyltransferase [Duganella sp. BJB1802]RFP17552.1 GNAT family N-acetyltransferase [Duganella sp. BJB489]RFP22063.1 GNAT family N-acetyltransferase [Duganella sp. BJB488]RFP37396.1 GNAT family N-acetyltransferase [Duganella sp. BJB480]
MTAQVTLQDIDVDNFESFMDMELPEHQRDFLDSNAYSIAQSKFYPDLFARGIYCDGEPAGFLLYDCKAEDIPGLYGIYRFMVDFPRQGKGIGRKAMALLLEELHAKPDVERIIIYYKPGNAVAQAFYRSFGFRECGIDDQGEMIAEIIPASFS